MFLRNVLSILILLAGTLGGAAAPRLLPGDLGTPASVFLLAAAPILVAALYFRVSRWGGWLLAAGTILALAPVALLFLPGGAGAGHAHLTGAETLGACYVWMSGTSPRPHSAVCGSAWALLGGAAILTLAGWVAAAA